MSLLWPKGRPPDADDLRARLSEGCAADLELDRLVESLCLAPPYRPFVQGVLVQLCGDHRVIAYRHAVLEDILSSDQFAQRLEAFLPKIDSLRCRHLPREKGEFLHEVAWRLGELEIFVECVRELASLLDAAADLPLSEGFRWMREYLCRLQRDETMQQLMRELPGMLSRVRGTRSITIGVNVDSDLQPSAATLLSINADSFPDRSPSFLRRLFGGYADREHAKGIAPLHRIPMADGSNPMLVPLFRDLSDLIARTLRPVAAALRRFAELRTGFLDQWGEELAFFLGAAKLIRRLRNAGLPVCRPALSELPHPGCEVSDCYNLVLVCKMAQQGVRESDLSARVVRNDVSFGASEISILTGPNQGGKTTYMQAAGLMQVMCQAGLYVPGSRASLGAVDGIFTHFPSMERHELDTGRFAEEVKRLGELFGHATPRSLILLNESLTATSPQESLDLARELVRALQLLGARVIYTTHLHELAVEADRFNAQTSGPGRVRSLVARSEQEGVEIRHTFKIEPGPPAGSSHARAVASRYGISFAQLVEVMRRRGIIE